VGYSAFALEDDRQRVTTDEAGRKLLALARAAIARELGTGAAPESDRDAWLGQTAATFVTLLKNGKLRGCIGSLEAHRPLREDVAANTVAAAFRDPRFLPLTKEEWPLCAVEVSLLSRPKTIRFADEADLLAQVRAGEDGIILECAGKHATYLPQVWEGLPDKKRFFAELKRKAGIPEDTGLARCKVRRYRVAKWKEEALH
jgi:hypothetical protein